MLPNSSSATIVRRLRIKTRGCLQIDKLISDHVIPNRPKTGTLAASTTDAKTAAAASVPATTKIGKGVYEFPKCAWSTSSAVRPNFVRVPVAVTSATASPRRIIAPA